MNGASPLRALHVEQDGRVRMPLQHILRERHQLPVGVDRVARARDHAQAIAVTVECEAQPCKSTATAALTKWSHGPDS
jgi:hypothetical protein